MIRGVALLLCLSVLAGCGAPAAPARDGAAHVAAPEAQHLRRQIDAFPRTLDPSLSTDVSTQRILDDLFEGLVTIDAAGSVVPAVASHWEQSANGLVWTFHLLPDARWSNGDPLTAADFVYAWRRTADPATASQSAQQLAPIVNAAEVAAGQLPPTALGVRALDPLTLEVRLVAPTPYFLYLVTNNYLFPLHEPTIRALGADWTRVGNLVCNGAFVLENLRINGAIQLRRNPNYRAAAAVQLQRVTYYPVEDRSAATSRYLAGDVDVTDGFAVEDIDWLRQSLGGQVLLAPYFGTVMLAMQVNRPPLDSRPLRLALTMAIDRDVLTQKLLRQLYLPAYNLVPPSDDYAPAVPEWAGWSAERRHARARELYAEAGYSARHPLVIDLSMPSGGADTRRLLEALTSMWRVTLGAEVRLSNSEWRVFQQDRRLHKLALYWSAWIGDYPYPLTFLELFQRSGGQNSGQYFRPEFEAAIAASAAGGDEVQRLAALKRAETVLNEDAPFIPIYFYQSRHLVRPYVQGWQGNVMDRHLSQYLSVQAGQGG
jgi:oligopeptide transport system substrate-binding protein